MRRLSFFYGIKKTVEQRMTQDKLRLLIKSHYKIGNIGEVSKLEGEADGSVPEDEYDLLVLFIRSIRVQEILFSLGETVRSEWREPEYTLYNFMAPDNLLRENFLYKIK